MPRGNKTGPTGEGPMTGRSQGFCTGNMQPGSISNQFNQGQGFGRGQGRGMGRRGAGQGIGFRHGNRNVYFENPTPVSEATLIENEIRVLKEQLSNLEKRLSNSKEE